GRLPAGRAQLVHSEQHSVSGFEHPLCRRLRSGLVPRELEPDGQLRSALGSQHALVRYRGQNRNPDPRRSVDSVSDRAEGLAGAGRSSRPQNAGADRLQGIQPSAGPRLFAERRSGSPGEDTRRAGQDQHSGRLRNLLHGDRGLDAFDIVADAPYGQYWVAPGPVLMQEPFRTRSDGSSQGVHFPFIFPIPGRPANKTLDYSIFLPIGGSPGYWYQNR